MNKKFAPGDLVFIVTDIVSREDTEIGIVLSHWDRVFGDDIERCEVYWLKKKYFGQGVMSNAIKVEP